MIGRLFLGLIKGALLGSLFAVALIRGLEMTSWDAAFAYVAGAVAGTLVGLFAGKPVWSKGAQVEAVLKAIVGAGLGALGMYAARRWLLMPLDLGPLSNGSMPLGEIPAASIALVSTAIAMLYELDNTGEKGGEGKATPGARGKAPARARLVEANDVDEDEVASSPKARRSAR